jgi:hypothetical protein
MSDVTCSYTGCPNKSARFNFAIKAPFIKKKVLIFLFHYKVHTLRLIVEHNIQQMSPTTQQSRGGRQGAHLKSCAHIGTPLINVHIIEDANGVMLQLYLTTGFL